jgi:hypothetical protein
LTPLQRPGNSPLSEGEEWTYTPLDLRFPRLAGAMGGKEKR